MNIYSLTPSGSTAVRAPATTHGGLRGLSLGPSSEFWLVRANVSGMRHVVLPERQSEPNSWIVRANVSGMRHVVLRERQSEPNSWLVRANVSRMRRVVHVDYNLARLRAADTVNVGYPLVTQSTKQ